MAIYMVRQPGEQQQGPYSGTQLRVMLGSGRIIAATEVRVVGQDRWVRADRVRGLMEHLGKPTPIEPAPVGAEGASQPAVVLPTGDGATLTDVTEFIVDPTDVPHYGVLRTVASAVAWWGWFLVGVALFACSAAALSVFSLYWMPSLEWLAVIGVLATLVLTFFVVRLLIRRAAAGVSFIPIIALVVVSPLLSSLPCVIAEYARRGNGSTKPFFSLLNLLGVAQGALILGISLVAFGLLFIAIGEFFVAHADIASNSWRRAKRPA